MTDWRDRLTVPRAGFIPSVIWDDDPITGGFRPVFKEREPERWHGMVAADEPVTTQVDDGTEPVRGVGFLPTSSCSKPSVVADVLDVLDIRTGHRVLEIGTGTGWNAALLIDRAGRSGRVVSVDVDPRVTEGARNALATEGYFPLLVTADGVEGYPAEAPYDRVVATASVRSIPPAWLDQTQAGGLIVAPWGTDYGEDALTRLRVQEDGSASGRFGMRLAFMRVRGQRRNFLDPTDKELLGAERSVTARIGRELFEMLDFEHAAFTIGLRVPHCYPTVVDIDEKHRHVELHDIRSESWARVILVRDEHPWIVHQLGPRRLWDEVEAAYTWWSDTGRPGPWQYELTVTQDGTHTVRVDAADGVLSWNIRV
ncbi:protein-L-isoaspartate(D-aspartate) O-methyltransferase [Actinopolyspora mzabensis]|uniref:Protein-L-isoaspartate O-methyltransferase n=1 Tax=Actinopolyspora mzabensis TaxID=995066 RepID=A0A1G8VTC9_ACTMZ|nr:protein-L-isoaspartate(D-aspartate) O-methyltransferase [Actinopolyspora mzabensis]